MSIHSGDETHRQPPGDGCAAPGDRVQINTGQLAGLTGQVEWLRDNQHCVLRIEGLTDGVYVVVHSTALKKVKG